MKTFETFLRVDPPRLSDEAPALDESWMAPRGIDPISPSVLRHLRDDVSELLTGLYEGMFGLEWFAFLVHAYPLVPTTPDDAAPYIHLRLGFDEHESGVEEMLGRVLAPKWRMTRPCELGEIAGVDGSVLRNAIAWELLNAQSQWMMEFIEAHKNADLGTLTKHVRQFLHFFANMAQMRVA